MTAATLETTINRLCTMWPYRAKTVQDVRALTVEYWSALRDLTDDEIQIATEAALATCPEFPSAGTLRQFARPKRDPNLDRDPTGRLRAGGHLALPSGQSGALTDEAIADAYAYFEATAQARRDEPPTPRGKRGNGDRPTLAERLTAYPGKEGADAILAGFPLPEVGLGADPPLPRVRQAVTWAALEREKSRKR
jgi:hypothetical protein